MAEFDVNAEVTPPDGEDPGLTALHKAAFRAEEAAARIQNHAVAVQPLFPNLDPKPALRVLWTAPLTPDDSAEENLEIVKTEVAHQRPYPTLAANSTTVAKSLSSAPASITSSGKKRGRPRKLNLVDNIVGQGQERSISPAVPKPKGRPPVTGKFKTRDHYHFSRFRALQPAPAKAEPLRVFVSSRLVDRSGEELLPEETLQVFPNDVSRLLRTPFSFSLESQGQESSSVTPSASSGPSNESKRKTTAENNILKAIFNSDIAPIMHSAMISFEHKLPRDVLVSVGRAVSHSAFIIVKGRYH